MGESKVRKHKRSSVLILLDVETQNPPERKGRACLVDISVSGTAFVSNVEFSKGEIVDMRFRLENDKIYVFEGIIRRVHQRTDTYLYGIKFRGKSLIDKLKTRKLMSELRSQ
jgi:hypothetical protein